MDIDEIKYREFVNSPSYALFKFVLNNEKNELIKIMVAENDKEKLWILKKQLDALNNLESNIQSKVRTITE